MKRSKSLLKSAAIAFILLAQFCEPSEASQFKAKEPLIGEVKSGLPLIYIHEPNSYVSTLLWTVPLDELNLSSRELAFLSLYTKRFDELAFLTSMKAQVSERHEVTTTEIRCIFTYRQLQCVVQSLPQLFAENLAIFASALNKPPISKEMLKSWIFERDKELSTMMTSPMYQASNMGRSLEAKSNTQDYLSFEDEVGQHKHFSPNLSTEILAKLAQVRGQYFSYAGSHSISQVEELIALNFANSAQANADAIKEIKPMPATSKGSAVVKSSFVRIQQEPPLTPSKGFALEIRWTLPHVEDEFYFDVLVISTFLSDLLRQTLNQSTDSNYSSSPIHQETKLRLEVKANESAVILAAASLDSKPVAHLINQLILDLPKNLESLPQNVQLFEQIKNNLATEALIGFEGQARYLASFAYDLGARSVRRAPNLEELKWKLRLKNISSKSLLQAFSKHFKKPFIGVVAEPKTFENDWLSALL